MWVEFAADSLLEQAGFELPVPLAPESLWKRKNGAILGGDRDGNGKIQDRAPCGVAMADPGSAPCGGIVGDPAVTALIDSAVNLPMPKSERSSKHPGNQPARLA